MSTDDPQIGTFCGSTVPSEFVSTSNVLYVQFYTDSSISAAGFNATYTQQDCKWRFNWTVKILI